jgi:hypothetical protein
MKELDKSNYICIGLGICISLKSKLVIMNLVIPLQQVFKMLGRQYNYPHEILEILLRLPPPPPHLLFLNQITNML